MTIQEKYNLIKEGKYSKNQFVIDARKQFPNIINQFTGFNDAVNILRSKSILNEWQTKKESPINYKVDVDPSNFFSFEEIQRGVEFELEKRGFTRQQSISNEEYEKAKKTALSNLENDKLYYLNMLAGAKSVSHDKRADTMKPVSKENDKLNAMQKVQLKESIKDIIRDIIK